MPTSSDRVHVGHLFHDVKVSIDTGSHPLGECDPPTACVPKSNGVSIYVAIRRPRVHHARACSAHGNDLYRITYVHLQWVKILCVRILTV